MRSNLIWIVSATFIFIHCAFINKEQVCTKLTKADAYRNETMKG